MPLRKKVLALKCACLKNICDNIDSFWCKDYLENYKEADAKYLHIIGPFDDLPAALKHDVILHLGKASKLRLAHLELLIDESTTKVDFSAKVNAPVLRDGLLELISIRCQNLTEMDIDGCNKVTPRALLEAIPNFTKLKILRMHGTKCNNQVLAAIGHYCNKLSELNLSHCKVNDHGIRNLIHGSSEGSVQCPDMTKLDLEATDVTAQSVQLALLSLPRLLTLRSDLLLEALSNLHEDEYHRLNERIGRDKQYQLLHIGPPVHNLDAYRLGQNLSVAVAYCPFVSDVTLFECATDECLLTISQLENLKSLSLLQCFESVSFENGVLPLLQIRGPQLHKLKLEIHEIDTRFVAYFCPNVEQLALVFHVCSNSYLTVRLGADWKPFSSLARLSVSCLQVSIERYSLLLLLKNCQMLRYLFLSNVANLTDEVLAEVYQSNVLDNLESLCLERCDSVTMDSIWPMLERHNELRVLRLVACEQITLQDSERIGKEIRRQNNPLQSFWS